MRRRGGSDPRGSWPRRPPPVPRRRDRRPGSRRPPVCSSPIPGRDSRRCHRAADERPPCPLRERMRAPRRWRPSPRAQGRDRVRYRSRCVPQPHRPHGSGRAPAAAPPCRARDRLPRARRRGTARARRRSRRTDQARSGCGRADSSPARSKHCPTSAVRKGAGSPAPSRPILLRHAPPAGSFREMDRAPLRDSREESGSPASTGPAAWPPVPPAAHPADPGSVRRSCRRYRGARGRSPPQRRVR